MNELGCVGLSHSFGRLLTKGHIIIFLDNYVLGCIGNETRRGLTEFHIIATLGELEFYTFVGDGIQEYLFHHLIVLSLDIWVGLVGNADLEGVMLTSVVKPSSFAWISLMSVLDVSFADFFVERGLVGDFWVLGGIFGAAWRVLSSLECSVSKELLSSSSSPSSLLYSSKLESSSE